MPAAFSVRPLSAGSADSSHAGEAKSDGFQATRIMREMLPLYSIIYIYTEYIYIYICMYVYTCTSIYISIYTYLYIHTCMHACMHACIHTYIYTHTYNMYVFWLINRNIYIYVNVNVIYHNPWIPYKFETRKKSYIITLSPFKHARVFQCAGTQVQVILCPEWRRQKRAQSKGACGKMSM